MSTLDPATARGLELLAPDISAVEPAWADVVERAGAARRTRVRRRVTVAIVALAAILVAAPALAAHREFLRFLGIVAPADVQDAVRRAGAPSPVVIDWLGDQGLGIRPATTRGIARLVTPSGLVRLWAVKGRDGGICRFVQMPGGDGTPNGPLACAVVSVDQLDAGVETSRGYALRDPVLHGQVGSHVKRVAVRYADGAVQRVPIVDSFLLAGLEQDSGTVEIEAYDAAGNLVQNVHQDLDPPRETPVTQTRRLIAIDTAQGPATLLVDPGANLRRCYLIVAPNGSTGACASVPRLPLDHGYQIVGDGPTAVALLGGVAADDVTRVRLKIPGGWIEIPLHEGFFLYALGNADRPTEAELTRAGGAVERVPFD